MTPRVIRVIEVDEQRGDRTAALRHVKVYYSLDGDYLGEAHDSFRHHCVSEDCAHPILSPLDPTKAER